ncbi:MAG: glycoside hydrolase family 127 protein [Kiritimatiellae bacterium]|nr:glycoside hydrolase family 127 protein [Kiritimatiellia bacterium]
MPVTHRAVTFLALACTLAVLGGVQRERLADGRESGGTVLEGAVGRKANALFSERLLCDKARGDIFGETANAFVTRYDDLHPQQDKTRRRGFWQGEYWGKTMLSHCAYARYSGDPSAKEFVRSNALELVRRFQREDGYLATYDDPDFIVGGNWNIWGRKYTLWALVESYDLTGEKELLQAGVRMADHLAGQLKRLGKDLAETGCFAGLPSLSILKPMVMLAERTGERRFLDFARTIVADNDRADGRRPNLIANAFSGKPVHEWYPSPESWAKAYEMMSLLEGFLEYANATGEKRPLEAVERIWDLLARYECNAVGSVGYHDHFLGAASYPNTITESCDVVHWMRLCRYLYAATGRMRYLDAWEMAFLNAFLAGVFRDGAWGTHDVRSHGRRHLQGIYEVNMLYHFCCLDNDPRGFFDWADCQVVAGEERIDVNFYTDAAFTSDGVAVKISGDYPVGDEVRVKVSAKSPRTVRFRVPAWCRGGMRIDGKAVAPGASVETARMAGPSQDFTLKFDMPPRIEPLALCPITGTNLTETAIELFEMRMHNKEMIGFARDKPGIRIMRGPLLLAKARLAGDDDRTCFTDIDGLDGSWKASLWPAADRKTWGAWELTLEGKGRRVTLGVCDYMSAADFDDPRNSFSIWF